MDETSTIAQPLPHEADPAVAIVRTLRDAGHEALLAGGCVRDLLLNLAPKDFDVVTSAPPERIAELFPKTRHVGVQFGVVLVRKRGAWIEVATFRVDGPYLDGRRPSAVTFTDARGDAARRDFTVNGMFLDPLRGVVIDYVGGRADLNARLIRAIGRPADRFEEDHLRLLRAVRFAARLNFALESETFAAIRSHAPRLARVAPERVREELERMLTHPGRSRAWLGLVETGLLDHLWPAANFTESRRARAGDLLNHFDGTISFSLALAAILGDRPGLEIEDCCRALTCSNEHREAALWLAAHQADLDEPSAIGLADLKRRMAHPSFGDLMRLAAARCAAMPDGQRRSNELRDRVAAIPPDSVEPTPLVTGADLLERGVPPGPLYSRVLDAIYTLQLEERICTRQQALAELARRVDSARGVG